MEAAIMLRAFDDAALHQANGKMRIAMGAKAVSRIELLVIIAVDCVGFSVVIETHRIGAPQIGRRAHFHASRGIGLRF